MLHIDLTSPDVQRSIREVATCHTETAAILLANALLNQCISILPPASNSTSNTSKQDPYELLNAVFDVQPKSSASSVFELAVDKLKAICQSSVSAEKSSLVLLVMATALHKGLSLERFFALAHILMPDLMPITKAEKRTVRGRSGHFLFGSSHRASLQMADVLQLQSIKSQFPAMNELMIQRWQQHLTRALNDYFEEMLSMTTVAHKKQTALAMQREVHDAVNLAAQQDPDAVTFNQWLNEVRLLPAFGASKSEKRKSLGQLSASLLGLSVDVTPGHHTMVALEEEKEGRPAVPNAPQKRLSGSNNF